MTRIDTCRRCGEKVYTKAEGRPLCLICQNWEDGEQPPEGAAACPFCGSVWLDATHAGQCCPSKRATT